MNTYIYIYIYIHTKDVYIPHIPHIPYICNAINNYS